MTRSSTTAPRNLGIQTHQRIRTDILSGAWVPGQPLRPAELAAKYETSSTVVRESLTKLVGEKLAVLKANRGFFVPKLSLTELEDLTELRCVVEGLGGRLAIERGDLGWESELIAAHHRLANTPRRTDDNGRFSDEWDHAHRVFHKTVLVACGVPSILDIARNLGAATQLYRRWTAPTEAAGSRDVELEHKQILDAVIGRDVDATAQHLRAHYEKTAAVILRSGLIDNDA